MKSLDHYTVLVIGSLLLLAAVPVVAGVSRLSDLAFSPPSPEAVRFFVSPIPVVLHIVSSLIFALLGPFQLVDEVRTRFPKSHRYGGRLLVFAGLASALSGIWMTIFYALPPEDRGMVAGLRLIFGMAMAISLLLGVLCVMKRNFAAHRSWLINLAIAEIVIRHRPQPRPQVRQRTLSKGI